MMENAIQDSAYLMRPDHKRDCIAAFYLLRVHAASLCFAFKHLPLEISLLTL